MLSFLEVYIHLLESFKSEDRSDHNSLSFFASKAECLAAKTSSGSYPSKIRHVTGLCNQISESLCSLKEGSRAQSLSAAASPTPTMASTGHGPGRDSFRLEATRGSSGSFGVRDPFWDAYSFPTGGSLDSDKMTSGHRAQADQNDLIDRNSLFLMPEATTSHMMPTDSVDFDAILNVLSGDHHSLGGMV